MTQGLADDGEGDLSVAGDGSPGVAGDIEGQRTGKADGAGDLAQVVADACLGVVVHIVGRRREWGGGRERRRSEPDTFR